MNRFIVIFSLLFISGCASTQSAMKNDVSFTKYQKVYLINYEEDPRKVLPKVQKQLESLGFNVVLTKEDEPLGGFQGTGFILTPDGYIVTSAHVLGKQKEATVWLNGKRYEAELVYKDENTNEDDELTKENKKSANLEVAMDASLNSKDNQSIDEMLKQKDMAILKIKSPDQAFTPVSFAKDPTYTMGQDVFTMGFPLSLILGDKPRLNKGMISSTVGMKDNPNYVQMSTEIQPGNSGGPLMNEKGQVVGMVQMTLNALSVMSQSGGALPQNVNFAIKSNLIREFLKDASDKLNIKLREGEVVPFDTAQNSIVQVRSGNIPESFKDEAKLVCAVSYTYLWDMWYRFQKFDVVFYDFDSDQILLRAGQYGDNSFSNVDKTINQTFKEIKTKLGR